MTKEQIIDLAEYYRERHNEICQDDFILQKPDYDKGVQYDWCNVRFIIYDGNSDFHYILSGYTVFIK